MLNEKLLATYSLLSFIRESHKQDSNESLLQVFIPLVLEGLNEYIKSKNYEEVKGKDYTEIKEIVYTIFSIEIPVRVLEQILPKIAEQNSNLIIYKDHSFVIHRSFNSNIRNEYNEKLTRIKALEDDYKAYCESIGENCDMDELISFIQDQKNRIFEKTPSNLNEQNYYVSKYVYDKIKRKDDFLNTICGIYLGGIIASYLKFQIKERIVDTELLIDTNFYISLINLNTEEAYETCKQLFDVTIAMGYRFSILETTIEQIKILLSNRAKKFEKRDLIAAIDLADILAACDRRGLSRSDLDSYKDNLLNDIRQKGITIVYNQNIRQLIDKTKKSKDLRILTKLRRNEESAFNDLLAKEYVNFRREGKTIAEFSDVNCWFLNNSYSTDKSELDKPLWQRSSITASDLLVLLWFANPSLQVKVSDNLLAVTSLSANVFNYRSEKQPPYYLVQKIEQKIVRLQTSNLVSQNSIANLCIRMSEGCIDGNEAQRIVSLNTKEFVQYIEDFKQQENKTQLAIKERDKLSDENSKLSEQIINQQVETKLYKMRVWGVVYLIGIIGIYLIYKFLFRDDITWDSKILKYIIDVIYWIITTIILNIVSHKYCLWGLWSFFCSTKTRDYIRNHLIKE